MRLEDGIVYWERCITHKSSRPKDQTRCPRSIADARASLYTLNRVLEGFACR